VIGIGTNDVTAVFSNEINEYTLEHCI